MQGIAFADAQFIGSSASTFYLALIPGHIALAMQPLRNAAVSVPRVSKF
jgi:hypothetical protein